jgi:hypothetical protein
MITLGIILPTTPRAEKSLIMSVIKKDSLLKNVDSPRIIFVGGSNLSFGLNSKMVKDSLRINPINTSIHASLGIKYMMESTIEYIKKGDIVVLSPEYSQYFRDINSGSEELLRVALDADKRKFKHFSLSQVINLLTFVPEYAFKKFKPNEYINVKESDIYSVNSFNEYGDAYAHWDMRKTKFSPQIITSKLNLESIELIKSFEEEVIRRGGKVYLTFPCFQDLSYDNSIKRIEELENVLNKSNLKVISSANTYRLNDSLMFNTAYHLTKKGVDIRTKLLINDIKKIMGN